MSTTLAEYMRAARQRLRMTLRELSRRTGLSPTYISNIETGYKPPPAESSLRLIAHALGVDGDFLMHLAGRIPADVEAIVLADAGMADFLRLVSRRRLRAVDLEHRLPKRRQP